MHYRILTGPVILLFWLTWIGCSSRYAGQHFSWTAQSSGCDYDSCNLGRDDMLNVHLVPHTHDDVGWLKTFDQYFYGLRNYIQRAGVQYILDSVVQALAANPERRFTYVEMAYFMRWWNSQTQEVKDLVRELVRTGRLQFALAGWTMADEATVHYSDAIDQLTRGHDALHRLFGDCGIPRVAWQIDPFGHSRDHTELFRDAGLDAVFFQRMDYREKNFRRESKSLEVLWETSVESNPQSRGLFTSMFYDSYCHPANFCFDDKCNDEPMIDDPDMPEYNIPKRVREFLAHVNTVRRAFATNHIMVLMGCDFTYENAHVNFKNIDKLIRYVNQVQTNGSDVNLLYSTPQCYTKAVNRAMARNTTIERRRGDFFPYASGPNSYWTGYYTSRPSLKKFIHDASNLLTAIEQLHFFADRATPGSNWKHSGESDLLVDRLRRAMGVMQHHDAVTGTEKQAVAYDYARLLSDGVNEGEKVVVNAMSKLLPNFRELIISQGLSFCAHLNMSVCDTLEAEIPYMNGTGFGGVYVMVYNPTGWHLKNTWFRLPIYVPNLRPELVNIKLYDLRTGTHIPMPFQLVPISTRVRSIPERRIIKSINNMELVFSASGTGLALPPAGFASYFLRITNEPTVRPRVPSYHEPTCSQLSYISKTMTYRLHVAEHGPRPVTIMALHKDGKSKLNITMQMLYYYGETSGMQASGAYVFLPKMKNISQSFPDPMVKSFSGECVEEVHLHYNVWATLVVRLYRNGEIETDWIVGPIPDHHLQFSREVIIRYQVTGDGIDPIVSGEFFTDSAGRRLIRRVRNERPDWNINYRYQETQPVAGNYYPVINRIMLKGSQRDVRHPLNYWEQNSPAMGFAVYTDRAQGGSSLRDGEVELMVHRRLIKDDGYGVAEALIENGIDRRGLIARGTHRLRLDELHVIEQEDQQLATKLSRPPKVIVAPAIRPPNNQDTLQWSALNKELPPHIHLLSLIAWPLTRATADPTEPDQLLLRLEHLGSASTSGDEELVLTSLFRGIRITDAREVTLTADQDRLVALHKRLRWPTEPVSWRPYSANAFRTRATHDIIVRLKPSTISTFLLRYQID